MADDIEASIYQWLPLISHLYPGITPFNIHDLTLDFWRLYVAYATEYVKARDSSGR